MAFEVCAELNIRQLFRVDEIQVLQLLYYKLLDPVVSVIVHHIEILITHCPKLFEFTIFGLAYHEDVLRDLRVLLFEGPLQIK